MTGIERSALVAQPEANGGTVTVYFDLVFLQRDRAVSVLANAFTAFDEREQERLARLVEQRMEALSAA